jgi:hypothetical protein
LPRAEQDLPEVERFLYGHHASKESLEQSKREGCVACSNYYMDGEYAETLDRFGYYTAFSVEFMNREDGPEFEMSINHNDGNKGEVAFVPYPRKLYSGKERASAITIATNLLQGRVQLLHSNLTNSTEDPAT